MGGVLNKVDLHRNPSCYYPCYRRAYAQYYSRRLRCVDSHLVANLTPRIDFVVQALFRRQRSYPDLCERQSGDVSPGHPASCGSAAATTASCILPIPCTVRSSATATSRSQAPEESLVRALDQQKRDALELNRKGIDYASLQRDAASNRQIFDSPLLRTRETGIAGDLKSSNIRVVDEAEVPRKPVRPNGLLALAQAKARPSSHRTWLSPLRQRASGSCWVDADMRKPGLHSWLGVALEPGLSNVMVGATKPNVQCRTHASRTSGCSPPGCILRTRRNCWEAGGSETLSAPRSSISSG